MNTNLTIVFAHNGTIYSKITLERLMMEKGFSLITLFDADQVLRWLQRRKNERCIIIVNNQLSHGSELSNEVTQNGRRSGEAIYARLRIIQRSEKTPVVIITVRSDEAEHMQELSDPYLVPIVANVFAIDTAILEAIRKFFPAEDKKAPVDPFEPREWGHRFAGNPNLGDWIDGPWNHNQAPKKTFP